MMRDDTGGRPKVIGNNMAMVAVGPRPGSTPIAVPRKTPIRQNNRLLIVKAVSRPIERLARSSMFTFQTKTQKWAAEYPNL